MNLKNGLILSIVLNVMFVALIFQVKGNSHNQAQEFVRKNVEPMKAQLEQASEVYSNNKILWEVLVGILDSDRSLRAATRIAKDARIPNREGEKALLSVTPFNADGQKGRRISWGKYSFDLVFDKSDKLASYSIEDLMDRGSPASAPSEDDESEE